MSTFAETLVARVTGIDKRLVAKARKDARLVKDADWLLENSCVHYTGDGLKKLCVALGVDAAALRFDGPAAAQPTDAAPAETPPAAATRDPSATPSRAFDVETLRAAVDRLPPRQLATAIAIAQDLGEGEKISEVPARPAHVPPGAPSAVGLPGQEIEHQLAAATVAAGVQELETTAEPVEIVVTRVAPNPRIVFGKLESRAVIVGVRDNKNFKPGMKLQAHHAGGDYYRMFGNCPRWPGRW